jgi:methylmalonyl-CoA/ethylmalonyl-CoA epimerase
MATSPADGPRIAGTVLDHVAHAVPRWQDVWDRYATDLGAVWASGGPGPGFAPGQLRFANGARVEVLMPWDVQVNDFLSRFLARSGPGPHHLTFKVPNLADAIEEIRRLGIEPINIDVSDPEWMEAFLHPKSATGVVVQLAEAPHPWSSPPPDDYPTDIRLRLDGSGPAAPATLERVCHVVADLGAARALFGGLLAGEVIGEGAERDIHWVDLRWSGPLGLRLVGTDEPGVPGPVSDWLGGLSGRIHHISVETEEPQAVRGARPVTAGLATFAGGTGPIGMFEVPGAENGGLTIVLSGFGGASGTGSTGR